MGQLLNGCSECKYLNMGKNKRDKLVLIITSKNDVRKITIVHVEQKQLLKIIVENVTYIFLKINLLGQLNNFG